jgi:hypothetical protein
MRYPREQWHENFDTPAYWRRAFGIIDELIHECRPERFFHIGMDEEEHRSYTQYVQAIRTLCSGLRRRGLKTVMWNDSAISRAAGSLFVEKARYAEQRVPRGVVQVLWNYHLVPRQDIRRIRARGLPLWGAPGRGDVRQARAFRDDVLRNGGVGLLMTTWMPCRRSTRTQLLASVRAMGSTYRGQN